MNLKEYKVILDTDIGDDIDDAFCLGLALKATDNLVCVTTVYKNTECRAKQARELIELCGKDIPVYSGETYPLNGHITPFEMDKGDLATIKPCQFDEGMNKFKYETGAVDKICEYAKKYSKKLVIMLIGPMTNMARALEKDPSIKDDIVAIYSMGGCFEWKSPEWNILCDADAAKTVVESGIPVHLVGFDITTKCPLDGSLLTDLRNSKNEMTQKIFTWFDRWMNYFHFEKSVMHDPLAFSSLIDEDIIGFTKKFVKIDLNDPSRGAFDVYDEYVEGTYPIYAATSVDKERFFKLIRKHFE